MSYCHQLTCCVVSAADEYQYEIISKIWDVEAKQQHQNRADECRGAWLEDNLEDLCEKKAAAAEKKAAERNQAASAIAV